MTEVPKIVHQRLKAAGVSVSVQAHPESDLLSAFAEQALSQTERENVLTHLAVCATCRGILVTALPEMAVSDPAVLVDAESPRKVLEGARRRGFLWPSLRWAALAAGITIAVFLARSEFGHFKSFAGNHATAQARQSASGPIGTQATGESSRREVDAKSEAPASNEISGTLSKSQTDTDAMASNTQTQSKRNKIKGLTPNASPALVAEGRALSSDLRLPTENRVSPIVRAKPAKEPQASLAVGAQPGTETTGLPTTSSAVLKQSPQWRIDTGALVRSLDGGRTWQNVLGSMNLLLCYASRGREMWAGGQVGMLLHSTDDGSTWSQVVVSFEGQPLKSDITNIKLQDLTAIDLTTGDGEAWTSVDRGKTWVTSNKKTP